LEFYSLSSFYRDRTFSLNAVLRDPEKLLANCAFAAGGEQVGNAAEVKGGMGMKIGIG
jgi:hypothetical protein